MATSARPRRPTWWGRFVMMAHREPEPRRQCNGCAGGGEINGVTCRDCGGRGYSGAERPQRDSTTTSEGNDLY